MHRSPRNPLLKTDWCIGDEKGAVHYPLKVHLEMGGRSR